MILEHFDVLTPRLPFVFDVPYPASDILIWRDEAGWIQPVGKQDARLFVPPYQGVLRQALFAYNLMLSQLGSLGPSGDVVLYTVLQGHSVGEVLNIHSDIIFGAFACSNREFVEEMGGQRGDRPSWFHFPTVMPPPPKVFNKTAWDFIQSNLFEDA